VSTSLGPTSLKTHTFTGKHARDNANAMFVDGILK
jgi:hypothetical protein